MELILSAVRMKYYTIIVALMVLLPGGQCADIGKFTYKPSMLRLLSSNAQERSDFEK